MQTRIWNIHKHFETPINGKNVSLVESKIEIPEAIEDLVDKHWANKLIAKQRELADYGIHTDVVDYSDHRGRKTKVLYEGDRILLWPGPVISLIDSFLEQEKLKLKVEQISYSMMSALFDKEVCEFYKSNGYKKPGMGLSICTYPITIDNKIVLTFRGKKVLYSQEALLGIGGNPHYTNVNIIHHQQGELADEIMLTKECYDSEKFRFGGIIEVQNNNYGALELFGWLPTNISSEEMISRFNSKNVKSREIDATELVFAPATEDLFGFILDKNKKQKLAHFCEAELWLYGYFKFGKEWATELIKEINKNY